MPEGCRGGCQRPSWGSGVGVQAAAGPTLGPDEEGSTGGSSAPHPPLHPAPAIPPLPGAYSSVFSAGYTVHSLHPNHPSPPTCPCSSGAVFNLHIHSGHTQAPRPHTKPLHRNPCHPERLPRARPEHPTAHNCWTPPGEPAAPKSRAFKIKLIFNSPANCVRSFGHSVIDLNSHPSPTPQEGLRHPKSSSAASSASRAWPSWIPPRSLLPSPLPLFSLCLHSLCHLSSLVLTNSHSRTCWLCHPLTL